MTKSFIPNLSIICASYNAEKTLERTILSVLNQTYEDYEFIVIDGASTDNTLSIIDKYKDHLQYITEKDKGIFDAMNKGIALSRGRWLFFIGSDDFLVEDNVLTSIFTRQTDGYDLILGNVIYDNNKLRKSSINYMTLFFNSCHHQGAFYKRDLFSNFQYDITNNISSDYELNLLLFLQRAVVLSTDISICECALSGVSSKANFSGYKKEMAIRKKLLNTYLASSLNLFTLLRYLIKRVFLFFKINLHYYH